MCLRWHCWLRTEAASALESRGQTYSGCACLRSASCLRRGWSCSRNPSWPAPARRSPGPASLWRPRKKTHRVRRGQVQEFRVERRSPYLESMPTGLKSSRCLVWKMSVLVRISRMDGGCIGVATQKSASCGGTSVPSSDIRCCPCTSFNRPRKFSACKKEK